MLSNSHYFSNIPYENLLFKIQTNNIFFSKSFPQILSYQNENDAKSSWPPISRSYNYTHSICFVQENKRSQTKV